VTVLLPPAAVLGSGDVFRFIKGAIVLAFEGTFGQVDTQFDCDEDGPGDEIRLVTVLPNLAALHAWDTCRRLLPDKVMTFLLIMQASVGTEAVAGT
jgi:hypothetical protein